MFHMLFLISHIKQPNKTNQLNNPHNQKPEKHHYHKHKPQKKPEPPQDNSTKGQSHLLSKQLLCTCLNRKAQEAPRFLSLFENLALVLSILLILLLFLYTLWKSKWEGALRVCGDEWMNGGMNGWMNGWKDRGVVV